MKKSLLFVFNSFPSLGGLESVSNNIIDYLGNDFLIYTLSMNSDDNVSASHHIVEMLRFTSNADVKKCVSEFNAIVKEKRISYIINQGIYPYITDIIFNSDRDKKVEVFSFLHGMPQYERKQYWQLPHIAKTSRRKLLKRKLLSRIGLNKKYTTYINSFSGVYRKACIEGDKVVLLCDGYIAPFLKAYNLNDYKQKVISIENPLSADFSACNQIDWNKKKNQILFVGRISQEKRVDIILRIWKEIYPLTDWELVIVGDGDLSSRMKDIVHLERIQKVTFVGQVANPQVYYEKAKIVLLTSTFEGFPMCLIEAQRFGVVPVAFNMSKGVVSILANGGGITVNNGDSKGMAKKLLELMNNDEGVKLLQEKVRVKSEQYTINRIGEKWMILLNNRIENEEKVN